MSLLEQTYHRFWSLLLLSAFLLPLTLQEAHVLLEHHEVKERCVASQEGDQHLHDTETLDFHCQLCCNKLAEFFDHPAERCFSLPLIKKSEEADIAHFPPALKAFHSINLRGPPSLT